MRGSVAKITTETNAVFYGFPQTPYLRGSSQDLTFLRLLETEFRNGTLSGERGNASHPVAQDVVGGRDLREATVEWILDADGLGAGVV